VLSQDRERGIAITLIAVKSDQYRPSMRFVPIGEIRPRYSQGLPLHGDGSKSHLHVSFVEDAIVERPAMNAGA